MTAATPGPSGPNIFSSFSDQHGSYRTRREAFAASMVGQAALLALIIYLTTVVIGPKPPLIGNLPDLKKLAIVFPGDDGGGGGHHEPLPASHGNPPPSSLMQLVPPTIHVPTEMPRLPAPQSIEAAPEVKLPQGGMIGDPLSAFTTPSDGPGGPGGHGHGCCGGDGDQTGPHVGTGRPGPYPAGTHGRSIPVAIYHPEPEFSEEARKQKQQGRVMLLLVVGEDGRTSDISVRQSLGMGLDEKAIDAVKRWRFRPATFDGQPVATQIEVEVDFHLY